MSNEQPKELNIEQIVRDVVREEVKPEIEKMKQQQTKYLQEGNMYLNE